MKTTDVEAELRKMVESLAKPAPNASKVCALAADIVANAGRYQSELENIANASMQKWEMNSDEFLSEFQAWAQNRARHALSSANA
jgi:hypothetical protein